LLADLKTSEPGGSYLSLSTPHAEQRFLSIITRVLGVKSYDMEGSERGLLQRSFDEDEEDDTSNTGEKSFLVKPRRQQALPVSIVSNIFLLLVVLVFALWPADDPSVAIWCTLCNRYYNHFANVLQHQLIRQSNMKYRNSMGRLHRASARTRASQIRSVISDG
jgi:hypothetical protein